MCHAGFIDFSVYALFSPSILGVIGVVSAWHMICLSTE
jgi:hypothetical protein